MSLDTADVGQQLAIYYSLAGVVHRHDDIQIITAGGAVGLDHSGLVR
jgi:hypothetical protein